MDIYIKSFNRPFLLHRCLASIFTFLQGFDANIIVLDDGTPQKYLDKIGALFPTVIIRKSPFYESKSKAIENAIEPLKKIPTQFWLNEVRKGSDRFILLEDDMWFVKSINYPSFVKELEFHRIDLVKMLWLKNTALISNKIKIKATFVQVIHSDDSMVNFLLSQDVLFNNQFKTNGVLKLFGFDLNKLFLKNYHFFAVAGAVYSKEYFTKVWENSAEVVDEMHQLKQLRKIRKSFNYGHTSEEFIKTSLKFTASAIDKERFGTKLNVQALNKLLNTAWLNECSYDVLDFNNEVSSQWIKQCCTSTEVDFKDWEIWYHQFKNSYEKIGCIID